MADSNAIFLLLRCSKCERRLDKPVELTCKHVICGKCLEIILKNHRTQACCPTCKRSLDNFDTENYTYLPANHSVSRMLSTFADVNRCETCKTFAIITKCSKCSKDQCTSCSDKHAETHRHVGSSPKIDDEFSTEEMQILESMKSLLDKNEYDDFIKVAREHLNRVVSNEDQPSSSNQNEQTTAESRNDSLWAEPEVYDWSKHEKFTEDDIAYSTPETVKKLLRLGFLPRKYQIRLARAGLKRNNSLICLQTGAGKTFVVGIIAKFFHIISLQKLACGSKSSNAPRKFKAVFLVPIKALITQQCDAFKSVFIDEPYSILQTVENQNPERFKSLYQQFDIFFFTVQKFTNFVNEKHTDITHFDMIIIDECHHCYDNHPVNVMMRRYHYLQMSGHNVPQIIGLTASVGTNKKDAFKHLIHLCANLNCLNVCAIEPGIEETELQNSTSTPLNDVILTVPKEENDRVVINLKDKIMNAIASRVGMCISSMDAQALENYLSNQHTIACKNNDHDLIIGCDYLKAFHRFLLYYQDLPLDLCVEWLRETLETEQPSTPTPFYKFCQTRYKEFLQIVETTKQSSTMKHKLKKLVEMILKCHGPGTRGLILVRTKFHASTLEKYLNKCSQLIEQQISVGYLTGQGSSDTLSLPGNQQATVLKDFRKGTKNLLVATGKGVFLLEYTTVRANGVDEYLFTDVAQEGLDVAECSYVIRYEFVSNEIGAVQSRGRARASQSKCFLITETLSVNHRREPDNQEKEREMKEALAKWRETNIQEFERLVQEERGQLLKTWKESYSEEKKSHATTSSTPPAAREVHCRFCDQCLCKGSDLRRQGTTVVCVNPMFGRLNLPKNAGEKFVCPNEKCHKEIGVVILLSASMPAYALYITSLKFIFKPGEDPALFKKWSLYKGHIEEL